MRKKSCSEMVTGACISMGGKSTGGVFPGYKFAPPIEDEDAADADADAGVIPRSSNVSLIIS